ncbi:hypothetical protein CAOG_04327 [Capsaspora owczarzaki ATCC 30864]|uniref:Uncharacterized protein n=1 Tax=Capsaspora owczarzaki (strain ATCC 30864) TaxID=595528 RepID=A0A0D2X323_CAPO3|nr:hypothetical protein CAOG_04327 [Capsaspora owczarzaki ATCC 30864]KJE93559.1 hypothetical protein CAOG_004327 [Capsaspora owczarzaki ATCC 30864]|eukprot:XP_004348155.2 hypothetical protein CAOG_04327 [Capsaspora owczarzaki ATCC 30864]
MPPMASTLSAQDSELEAEFAARLSASRATSVPADAGSGAGSSAASWTSSLSSNELLDAVSSELQPALTQMAARVAAASAAIQAHFGSGKQPSAANEVDSAILTIEHALRALNVVFGSLVSANQLQLSFDGISHAANALCQTLTAVGLAQRQLKADRLAECAATSTTLFGNYAVVLSERVQLDNLSHSDMVAFAATCEGLVQLCTLSERNMSMLNATWKALIRLVSRAAPTALRSNIPIGAIVDALSAPLLRNLKDCVTATPYTVTGQTPDEPATSFGDSKNFTRCFRVCRFYLSHLFHTVKALASSLESCYAKVIDIVLSVKGLILDALTSKNVTAVTFSELRSLVINADTIVKCLAINPLFCACLGSSCQSDAIAGRPLRLAQLTTVLALCTFSTDTRDPLPATVLDLLFPNAAADQQSALPLLDMVFAQVAEARAEILLPCTLYVEVPGAVPSSEQAQLLRVSLYQHTWESLCDLAVALPAAKFSVLERALMRQVLSPNSLCATLAADVWSFLAPRLPAHTLCAHLRLLGQLIVCTPRDQPLHVTLGHLISRLSSELPDDQYIALVEAFSPAANLANLAFWRYFAASGQAMSEQEIAVVQAGVSSIVSGVVAPATQALVQSCQPNQGASVHEIQTLACGAIATLFTSHAIASTIARRDLTTLIDTIVRCSASVFPAAGSGEAPAQACCALLNAVHALYPGLSVDHLTSIFTALAASIERQPLGVKLIVCKLLGRCAHFSVEGLRQPHASPELLQAWIHLFNVVLSEQHWLVLTPACVAWQEFAQFTPFKDIIGQLCPPDRMDVIKQFLCSTPIGSDQFGAAVSDPSLESERIRNLVSSLGECEGGQMNHLRASLEEGLRLNAVSVEATSSVSRNKRAFDDEDGSAHQPAATRHRLDGPLHDKLQQAITFVRAEVEQMVHLSPDVLSSATISELGALHSAVQRLLQRQPAGRS